MRTLLALLVLAAPAAAQYPSDPALNLALADGVATQDQPKVVATGDGGCYVSWYDSDPAGTPAFGYDVRLQRLDSAGNELWGHGGVLVADRGFSSTQDYGLAVDATGAALLAFRDDRLVGTQVTAARIDAAGNATWGPLGVQLTSTTDFLAAPKIAGTSDGGVVVAWTQNSDVRLQRLDAAGAPQWGAGVTLHPAAGSYSVADLHGSDLGAVILSFVYQTGGFGSPRYINAQKVSAAGAPLWPLPHVKVLDAGSLQFGNFPSFVPDGAGGAVFGWYTSSPALESWVQRLDASGAELFPHNGLAVSTDATRLRVSPSAAYDAASGVTYVACKQTNASQSQAGVLAQAIDGLGNRLFGPTGTELVALGGLDISDLRAVEVLGTQATPPGLQAFWAAAPAFGQDQLFGARLDAAGGVLAGPVAISNVATTKYRLEATRSTQNVALLVWRDERSGDADVYAQDVVPSLVLGGAASVTPRNGSGTNPTALAAAEPPRLGAVFPAGIDTTLTPGALASFTFAYAAPLAGLPLVEGELLVDPSSPLAYITSSAAALAVHPHAAPVPNETAFVGFTLAVQGYVLTGTGGVLTNALDLVIGL